MKQIITSMAFFFKYINWLVSQKPIWMYILHLFISFVRLLLGNRKWHKLRLRSRWHFEIGNQYNDFHRGIFKSMGTVYEKELGLSEVQDIRRAHAVSNFWFSGPIIALLGPQNVICTNRWNRECSPWRHGFDWLAEKPPLSPRSHPQKMLFLQGSGTYLSSYFVVNWNTRNILGYVKTGYISLSDHITRMKIFWQYKKKKTSSTKNYRLNVHNATAITTGSANQRSRPISRVLARLCIDVIFRGLKNSYCL